jgi:hypothetical protein
MEPMGELHTHPEGKPDELRNVVHGCPAGDFLFNSFVDELLIFFSSIGSSGLGKSAQAPRTPALDHPCGHTSSGWTMVGSPRTLVTPMYVLSCRTFFCLLHVPDIPTGPLRLPRYTRLAIRWPVSAVPNRWRRYRWLYKCSRRCEIPVAPEIYRARSGCCATPDIYCYWSRTNSRDRVVPSASRGYDDS